MKRLASFGLALGVVAAAAACGGGNDSGAGAGASPGTAISPAMGASPGAMGGTTGGTTGTMPPGATGGDFAVTVVEVDSAGNTITVRESAVGGTAAGGADAQGPTARLNVAASGRNDLASVKAGDRVTITCTISAGGTATGGAAGGAGGVLGSCTEVTAVRKTSAPPGA
jgi:hypothetical protein